MMHCSSVRYEKLRSTESNNYCAEDSDQETHEEEDEAAVFISQTSTHQHKVRQRKRGTWVRLSVALMMLGLALGFVLCEWRGCLSEENGTRGPAAATEHSGTVKNEEGHGHHYNEEQNRKGEDHDHHGNSGHHEHQHPNSLYHHGVVLTDSAICSGIGRGILEDGGNVVDAGLASLLCLGVVHPHATGVGGVFSAILYNGTSRTYKSIYSTFPRTPPAAYGIPATLQGIKQVHSLFGRCEWEKLFSGAAKLAKDGFHVDEALAGALTSSRAEILQSNLCDLFCDGKDGVKALGSRVTNPKLAALLNDIGRSGFDFSERLARKLAEDLPATERQGFVDNVRQCGAEINDPLIVEKEEYTVLAATSPLSGRIISDLLERARLRNPPPWTNANLNSSVSTYIALLTTAKQIYNNSLASDSQRLEDLFAVNPGGSHIGALDSTGNVLIISTSLNRPFGSKRLLPSTGVILSSFNLHPADNLIPWSCPFILKLKSNNFADGDDDEDDDGEVLAIGVTGGLSAPFVAAQLIMNKVHGGKSASEAVTGPLVHLEMGGPGQLSGCVSAVSNGSDVYQVLLERGTGLRGADRCSDPTLVLILQLHAGHLGAYGAPTARAHIDGY